jgi:DNA modification methylase
MQPFHIDQRCTIYNGNCLEVLASLPAKSVHCCVTSPPYWGLRDYGIEPIQWANGDTSVFGSEKTLRSYVEHSVEVVQAVMRVLRDDGVLWWNVGDSYATSGGAVGRRPDGESQSDRLLRQGHVNEQPNRSPVEGIPSGSKCLIPHRVAIALQDAGFIIRQDLVWAKKSPMPESVSGWRFKDGELKRGSWRHTNAHEYVFMVTKQAKYFCDGDAAKEPASSGHPSGNGFKRAARLTYADRGDDKQWNAETRNPRSVMSISTESYKGAHFATFPTALPRKLITASTSNGGCCDQCGQCYAPCVTTERVPTRPGDNTKVPGRNSRMFKERDPNHPGDYKADRYELVVGNRDPQRHIAISKITGYRQTCDCAGSQSVPCVVIDPFFGSGTTGVVAESLGRRAIGSELNPEYAALAVKRVTDARNAPAKKHRVKRTPQLSQRTLF